MVETTMRSAIEIVPYLLKRYGKGSVDLISPLKLQKLLYYAQAWSLVFRGKALFYEDIEAWIHGPVVPCVYRRYKHYGYNTLPEEDLINELKTDEIDILNTVLMNYGRKSAKFLEELSHSEYPWLKARKGFRADQPSNRRISVRDMMNYYVQFMQSEQPRKISPIALQKRKEPYRKGSTNPVLTGIGSVLDIFPTSSRRSFYVTGDFSTSLSDFESMCSDWEKVGGDIQTAIGLVEQKSSTEHE